jgi:hypothetical protein
LGSCYNIGIFLVHKEMPMQLLSRRPWWEQLDLFQAPPQRMTWTALPPPVQQEVKRLLARMLRQHLLRSDVIEDKQEVAHER